MPFASEYPEIQTIKAKFVKANQKLMTEYGTFKIENVYEDFNRDIKIVLYIPEHSHEKKLFDKFNLHLPIIKHPETLVRIYEG